MLTRDQIDAVNDGESIIVSVPEWGGDVLVGSLTGEERGRLETSLQRRPQDALVLVCALAMRGEDGKRLYTDADLGVLAQKSSVALYRIFNAALEVNGMDAKAIETASGNSGGAPNDNSGSA